MEAPKYLKGLAPHPGHVSNFHSPTGLVLELVKCIEMSILHYQFPFIADEREVRSTLLERLFGIVDVRGDREVLMLYSSLNRAADSALIWQYGPSAQFIVVGITAGDPQPDARMGPLS
jgi:hypothetical protein